MFLQCTIIIQNWGYEDDNYQYYNYLQQIKYEIQDQYTGWSRNEMEGEQNTLKIHTIFHTL
jgi:hypothetical protein